MSSTKTEKKAINALENYLEDSDMIDSNIASNDKEMSWDGNLYVYSQEDMAKENYMCRIPVQVKGRTMDNFKSDYSFPIETPDLKAYLTEGTLYFVIQVTPHGKMIFYRELYPLTINRILKGHRNQKSISVKMRELAMPIQEFEQFLIRFSHDCKKQVSAVVGNAKPFKIEDMQKRNLRKFNFTAPQQSNPLMLFSYLSTHPTFIYGELQEGVEWPIGDIPVTMNFSKGIQQPVKVGERTYFDGFHAEIKGECLNISVGGVMEFSYNVQTNEFEKTVHFHQRATTLKSAIQEAEFVLDLMEHQQINVGEVSLNVLPNSQEMGDYYRERLPHWRDLARALEKVGYYGDLDIDKVTDADAKTINILIDTMLKANYYDLKDVDSGLVNLEFLGLNLLVWVVRQSDKKCMIGNAFDGTVQLQCQPTEGVFVPATIYSYLSSLFKWESCDNIDFGGMIAAYNALQKDSHLVYEMANVDVLEMIKAADRLTLDKPKAQQLLDAAMRLAKWLEEKDSDSEFHYAYILNQLQIRKRRGDLSADDKKVLNGLLIDTSVLPFVKAGAALLLENKDMFEVLYAQIPDEEKEIFDKFPINKWRN